LSKHMRVPGLEVRQMLTRVRADVATETHGRQIPWDNSSLLGEVYLAGPGKSDQGRVSVTPAAPMPAADEILWGAIKDSDVSAVFEEFVRKFPASRHARDAQGRAEDLRKTDVAMLPSASGTQIGKLLTAPTNGPIASFTRHNGGWSVALSFAEPVT